MEDSQLYELVRSAQEGSRSAFGKLATAYEPMVFAVVLKRLRNRAEAHELTQDVLIQAMRKLTQLREPERFVGWLRRIAVRMSINRAVRRPPETLQSPDSFQAAQGDPATPLDHLLQSERARSLWGGLKQLGDLDRRTLIAFYFEGQSLKEMSDAFERPIGTIKRRLHTARNRLRDQLSDLQLA